MGMHYRHEGYSDQKKTTIDHTVSILITDGFSLLSLASLTDVFGAVDALSAARVNVRVLSIDGNEVHARSAGIIRPDGALQTEKGMPGVYSTSDAFILITGDTMDRETQREALDVVRRCKQMKIPVCAMGGVVRALAQTRQIRQCTDHWARIAVNSELVPDVDFKNEIFVSDGNLTSCCGELGALDFALDWVSSRICPNIVVKIRNMLLVSSSRSADRGQTCSVADTFRAVPKALQDIIDMMLQNIEAPLPMDALSHRASLSTRQVERLFARHLSTSPAKYYRSLQLERARILIEDTNLTVSEIAVASGFSSQSRFARVFRQEYGVTPTRMRAVKYPVAPSAQANDKLSHYAHVRFS